MGFLCLYVHIQFGLHADILVELLLVFSYQCTLCKLWQMKWILIFKIMIILPINCDFCKLKPVSIKELSFEWKLLIICNCQTNGVFGTQRICCNAGLFVLTCYKHDLLERDCHEPSLGNVSLYIYILCIWSAWRGEWNIVKNYQINYPHMSDYEHKIIYMLLLNNSISLQLLSTFLR